MTDPSTAPDPVNTNEYDDGAYQVACDVLEDAVSRFWEAGAQVSEMHSEFENAIRNTVPEPDTIVRSKKPPSS